jgi:succinyl-CoA synthetase beta subunit
MNIHEYQGKEILASYGVRIQRGIVANNAVEAVAAAKQLTTETGTSWFVIKTSSCRWTWKGGGKTCQNTTSRRGSRSNYWNAISYIKLLQKVKVHKVLVAEDVYYPGESETSEFYVSVLLNRATGRNMIMYSTEGNGY